MSQNTQHKVRQMLKLPERKSYWGKIKKKKRKLIGNRYGKENIYKE